jgi:hypothetical protein
MWGMHARAACCLSGMGAPPGRRGENTRRMLAASSGQGHARASTGLPTPCRREHSLHVSQPRIDSARLAVSSTQGCYGLQSCPTQTTVHLVHPGIRRRSMVQVRVLARWFHRPPLSPPFRNPASGGRQPPVPCDKKQGADAPRSPFQEPTPVPCDKKQGADAPRSPFQEPILNGERRGVSPPVLLGPHRLRRARSSERPREAAP